MDRHTQTIVRGQKVLVSQTNCEVDGSTGVDSFPTTDIINLKMNLTTVFSCVATVPSCIVLRLNIPIETNSYSSTICFKLNGYNYKILIEVVNIKAFTCNKTVLLCKKYLGYMAQYCLRFGESKFSCISRYDEALWQFV